MRYSVDATLSATSVDADASGRVQAFLRKAGSTDHRRLRLTATGLDPRTAYTVLAQIGEDTNYVAVTNFITTRRGSARILYTGSGVNNAKRSLPQSLEPVTTVRSLAVANTNGEIVLSVAVHEAESMKFELASIFENTGNDALAIGCVAVAVQGGGVQFRLLASGESSQMTFCVNGDPVQTYDTAPSGYLNVSLFPSKAPSPLDFRSLSLRNSLDTVVLQSDLR